MQNESTFQAERMSGLGGSDMAAICGLSPYKTKLQVFLEKTGKYKTEETEAMWFGTEHEPTIAKRYSIVTGAKLIKGEFKRSYDYPFFFGHADYLSVIEPFGVECKAVGGQQARRWGAVGTDNLPQEYLAQCQWYCYIYGLPRWDVAAMITGNELRVYTIKASDEFIDNMILEGKHFWEKHIQNNIAPPIEDSPRTAEMLQVLYPRSTDKIAEPNVELLGIVNLLKEERSKLSELESRCEFYENTIKAAMGEASILDCGDDIGKITWKSSVRSSVDYKGLIQELAIPAEVVEKHKKTTELRTFRVPSGWGRNHE